MICIYMLAYQHSPKFVPARATFGIIPTHITYEQGRGKVFYVGGAVCVCVCVGGGGGSQFLHINITPNRNRKSCCSLRTFMRSC